MSDHDGAIPSEVTDQAAEVAGQFLDPVMPDPARSVTFAVAAQFRRDTFVRRRKGAQLMAPGVPALRKPMQHHDQRTVAGHRRPHSDCAGQRYALEMPWIGRDHAAIGQAAVRASNSVWLATSNDCLPTRVL